MPSILPLLLILAGIGTPAVQAADPGLDLSIRVSPSSDCYPVATPVRFIALLDDAPPQSGAIAWKIDNQAPPLRHGSETAQD